MDEAATPAADLLTRLAERQRSPRVGVAPVLPSRFEPSGDSGAELVEEVQERESAELLAPPGEAAPAVVAAFAGSPAAPEQPVLGRRPPVPAVEPSRQGSSTPRPAFEEPTPHHGRAPEHMVAEPESVGPERRRTPSTGDASGQSAQPAEPAPHGPTPVQPATSARSPHLLSAETAHVTSLPPVLVAESALLPEPMVQPVPDPVRPPVSEQREQPEQPSEIGPLTISVSIGRIEVHAPAPVPDTPAAPRRPVHQPRLSLEDYLARPNRGRS